MCYNYPGFLTTVFKDCNMAQKAAFFAVIACVCICISCSRPVKKTERVFRDNYEIKRTLIITSKVRETEGYIHVLKKPIERTFGDLDTLYMVYKKDQLVGFVTADKRAYRYSGSYGPYEDAGESNKYRHQQHIGTWRTLELNVQKILELPYPVKIY